ncbi:hypothetical protein [Actinoplanes sp. NPDC051851]|uniref:hypothetical protein n=1 Tax=Actinoplanes sp. NPDC051851 TaxID=3154753 RepID=UPI003447B46F
MTDFVTAVERLLGQIGHWEERRWQGAATGAAPATGGSRADLVRGLVQRLADLGAAAERRAPRPVPRIHDLVLPDQLRVIADDLTAANPSGDVLRAATAAVDEVRAAL